MEPKIIPIPDHFTVGHIFAHIANMLAMADGEYDCNEHSFLEVCKKFWGLNSL
jgi:tellurite resistance protein